MEFEITKNELEKEINSLENAIKNEKQEEERLLEIIRTRIGDPYSCISNLRIMYDFQGLLELLKYQDVDKFRENMFISGKLYLMSREKINYFMTGHYSEIFPIIMSNNTEMREFLVKNMESIVFWEKAKEYGMTGVSGIRFLNKNILLALKGDFKQLKERSEKFIEKCPKAFKKHIIDHEFYIALCNRNIEEMKEVIYRMLEKKIAKIMLNGTDVFFKDFLHIQVLLFTKIALLHRYDLGINHINAPKELIDNTPLKEYPEPYEFMNRFRFDFTIEEWKKWIEDNKSRGVRR